MVMVLLDIGAGGCSFVNSFKESNPHLEMMYLCGEPDYVGVWDGVPKAGKIKKIHALYSAFNVPKESLNIVTMNGSHAFVSCCGIDTELLRTLKPGGVFISVHPIGFHPKLDEHFFEPVVFGKGELGKVNFVRLRFERKIRLFFKDIYDAHMEINGFGTITYPASRVNAFRLEYMNTPKEFRGPLSSYIYKDEDGLPSIQAWRKK